MAPLQTLPEELLRFLGQSEESFVRHIPIAKIQASPHQPRRTFAQEELASLAQSIAECGILQPLVVNKQGDDYYLVAGERRLRAAALAGLEQVPCITYDKSEEECAVATMVENLQRQNLSFWEEAHGYKALLDRFGYTQEQLAAKIGRSQSTVANKLRLLRLPQKVQVLLTNHGLTERHARALLALIDHDALYHATETIIQRNYTVAQAEQYVQRLLRTPENKPKLTPLVRDRRICRNTIRRAVTLIQQAGIKAVAQSTENDTFIEYIIRIPKG